MKREDTETHVTLGPEHGFHYPDPNANSSPILLPRDPAGLRFLNREERRRHMALLKKYRGKFYMLNLNQPIEAVDADGTVIKNAKEEIPTVKEIALYGLRQAHVLDRESGFDDKNIRYQLAKRIEKADELEITETEAKILKKRVGALFVQIDIVGKFGELVDAALETKSA
mgnify:CR=1 FL=1